MISIILYQLYAMNGSYIENKRVYIYICSKNVGLGGGGADHIYIYLYIFTRKVSKHLS